MYLLFCCYLDSFISNYDKILSSSYSSFAAHHETIQTFFKQSYEGHVYFILLTSTVQFGAFYMWSVCKCIIFQVLFQFPQIARASWAKYCIIYIILKVTYWAGSIASSLSFDMYGVIYTRFFTANSEKIAAEWIQLYLCCWYLSDHLTHLYWVPFLIFLMKEEVVWTGKCPWLYHRHFIQLSHCCNFCLFLCVSCITFVFTVDGTVWYRLADKKETLSNVYVFPHLPKWMNDLYALHFHRIKFSCLTLSLCYALLSRIFSLTIIGW